MQTKLIHDDGGQKTYAVVLAEGDEVVECLQSFANGAGISAASLKAIGAFEKAELAYFDWEQKEYQPIPVDEQVEVASLLGDIAIGTDGAPALHLHAVLGRRDGTTLAGHLQLGLVRPTLEIILTESPAHLQKAFDPASGLALISLDRTD